MWDEYLFPGSIQETLEILQSRNGNARIIAGGTDLIPQLKARAKNVSCLVDISRIKELSVIEEKNNSILVGAGVTHAQLASSPLIRKRALVLAEAALAIGSPLIRNQGTIAGNIINAQPAADTAVALFSLDAQVEISTIKGNKTIPIDKLYDGIGISKIDSTAEIVTAVCFKCLEDNQGSSFQRLAQRKALALPMLNAAAVVMINKNNFDEARITVAPVAPLPFRAHKAEAALKGTAIDAESINKAADLAAMESQPRDSALRGSSEYRREMVTVLVRRALNLAVQRARKPEQNSLEK